MHDEKKHGRETDFSMYRYFLKMSKLSWDSTYLCHIFTSFFSQIILRHYNTMYMYQRNHIYTRILFYALYSLTVLYIVLIYILKKIRRVFIL